MAQPQVYMLIPVSPDQVTASNLPQGARYVQLTNPALLSQGPVTVTSFESSRKVGNSPKRETKWADSNPMLLAQNSVQPTTLVQTFPSVGTQVDSRTWGIAM